MNVCIAYPCAFQNRQILSSRISETLSLNNMSPSAGDGTAKLVNVFQYTTRCGVLPPQRSRKSSKIPMIRRVLFLYYGCIPSVLLRSDTSSLRGRSPIEKSRDSFRNPGSPSKLTNPYITIYQVFLPP